MTRLSSNTGHVDYWADIIGQRHFEIRVDGITKMYCVAVDTEAGWADVMVRDSKGHVKEDPNKPGEIWIERLVGTVEIIPAGKNKIERGFFEDKYSFYLNGIKLSNRTRFLLTEKPEPLMNWRSWTIGLKIAREQPILRTDVS